ncbi:hypothetical protein [Haladaptatus sp. CMAA 1911]|uniref:hypothetical protein n=1 Tax=unclassified Haladaptatus TaxID=2622732 RepID=UPI0037551518
MILNNKDSNRLSKDEPKIGSERTKKRLSDEEKNQLLERLTGEQDVKFEEVDSPFGKEDKPSSGEIEELLE